MKMEILVLIMWVAVATAIIEGKNTFTYILSTQILTFFNDSRQVTKCSLKVMQKAPVGGLCITFNLR